MAVSGRMDYADQVTVPATPASRDGNWHSPGNPEYTLASVSSMRGRWFRFVTPDPEVEGLVDDEYALFGQDVSASQTMILAVFLGLKQLEDIASAESFNKYLARRAWEDRPTLLNVTGTDADYQ